MVDEFLVAGGGPASSPTWHEKGPDGKPVCGQESSNGWTAVEKAEAQRYSGHPCVRCFDEYWSELLSLYGSPSSESRENPEVKP